MPAEKIFRLVDFISRIPITKEAEYININIAENK